MRDYLFDHFQYDAMLNFLIIYLIRSNQSDFLNKKLFNAKDSIQRLKNVIDECETLHDRHESTNELKIEKEVRRSLRRQKRYRIIILVIEKIDQLVSFVEFLTDHDDHVLHFDQIHEKFVHEQNERSIDKDNDFLFQFKTDVSEQPRQILHLEWQKNNVIRIDHAINVRKIDRISNDVNLIKISAILQRLLVLNVKRAYIEIVAKDQTFFHDKQTFVRHDMTQNSMCRHVHSFFSKLFIDILA